MHPASAQNPLRQRFCFLGLEHNVADCFHTGVPKFLPHERLQQKLEGLEDPTSGEAMSVQGQVQLLLNEATDPENLCMLYHGWAPWL